MAINLLSVIYYCFSLKLEKLMRDFVNILTLNAENRVYVFLIILNW